MIVVKSLILCVIGAGFSVLLAACVDPGAPSSLTSRPQAELLTDQLSGDLASWIRYPSTLPSGKAGTNNCTFAFGQNVPQWDFHPDAGCWEHAGPDGWTRQHFERIHVPSFPACAGGSGDAHAIRVCRAGGPGQASPCLIDSITGPTGCARCMVNPTCH